MIPRHHPPVEVLLDHAAGALEPTAALVIDCHAAMCAECRQAVATFEAAGGELLDQVAPAALGPGSLEAVLARLDAAAPVAPPVPPAPLLEQLPRPLRPHAARALAARPWASLIAGVRALDLDLPVLPGGAVQILEIAAGRGVPRHGHGGSELVLVLSGAFTDETGRYGAGDLQFSGRADTHRPVAEPGETCRVLAVADAPLRLTGLLGIAQKILGRNG